VPGFVPTEKGNRKGFSPAPEKKPRGVENTVLLFIFQRLSGTTDIEVLGPISQLIKVASLK
jgi:hypothetical protein